MLVSPADWNVYAGTASNPVPMVALVNDVQPWNTLVLIDVTLFGMDTDVRPAPEKAYSPILVTEEGMVADAKYGQS